MYKAFNEDLTNRYGKIFEIDKIYNVKDEVKFGNNGNGFHMCKNMEDTFRYFDFQKKQSIMAEVLGIGEKVEYEDDYYGYYDMYAYRAMKILQVLSREQILEYFTSLNSKERIDRFLTGYRFTINELLIIKEFIIKHLEYSYMSQYLHLYQEVKYEQLKKM